MKESEIMSIPVIGGGASWGNNGASNEENSMVSQDLSSQLVRVLPTVHFYESPAREWRRDKVFVSVSDSRYENLGLNG